MLTDYYKEQIELNCKFFPDGLSEYISSFIPIPSLFRTISLPSLKLAYQMSFYDNKLYIADHNACSILCHEIKNDQFVLSSSRRYVSSNIIGLFIKNDIFFISYYNKDNIALIDDDKMYVLTDYELEKPYFLSVWKENIYVASQKHNLIIVFNLAGQIVTKIGRGLLESPRGIFIDEKKIFVTDKFSLNIFDHYGNLIDKWENLAHPVGIFVSKYLIYIADFSNKRVVIYDKNGEIVEIWNKNMGYPISITSDGKNIFVLCHYPEKCAGHQLLVFQ